MYIPSIYLHKEIYIGTLLVCTSLEIGGYWLGTFLVYQTPGKYGQVFSQSLLSQRNMLRHHPSLYYSRGKWLGTLPVCTTINRDGQGRFSLYYPRQIWFVTLLVCTTLDRRLGTLFVCTTIERDCKVPSYYVLPWREMVRYTSSPFYHIEILIGTFQAVLPKRQIVRYTLSLYYPRERW